ncbi:DUF1848 domain-containing protein [Chitinispirillales bacterium ANBcel5]|uniref:DUF1848 domain-containing protein n=1 Tax=Cellulosispirillum alkaliphilum TaxID=3039283 RepID=UPI002A557246|nr:DUF1848 domain-containing protein [Chitinispirillales bacterium ANBcel5]
MGQKQLDKVLIQNKSGQNVEAIAPLIISASRSTDLPAHHSDWFFNRLSAGYAKWVNPFNGKEQYVSFRECRLFVFWSKYPAPFTNHLEELEKRGLNYYFHFTLNDYEAENYEPQLPPLMERIDTFVSLSERIGPGRVLWRFDPLIISDKIDIDELLERVSRIGKTISQYTSRLTVSFLTPYQKVINRCKKRGVILDEISREKRDVILKAILQMSKEWNIDLFTCAEENNYNEVGIPNGKCVDEQLIVKEFNGDTKLMNFLCEDTPVDLFTGYKFRSGLKDTGQRKNCNCIKSKDIGKYNTCLYDCVYCYANSSSRMKEKMYDLHSEILGG